MDPSTTVNIYNLAAPYVHDMPTVDVSKMGNTCVSTFILKPPRNTQLTYEIISEIFEKQYRFGKIEYHQSICYIQPDGSFQNIIIIKFDYINHELYITNYIYRSIKTYGAYNVYSCIEYNEPTVILQMLYDKSIDDALQNLCVNDKNAHPEECDINTQPKLHDPNNNSNNQYQTQQYLDSTTQYNTNYNTNNFRNDNNNINIESNSKRNFIITLERHLKKLSLSDDTNILANGLKMMYITSRLVKRRIKTLEQNETTFR